MTNVTAVLQMIDQIFTSFIFVPMIFILYCKFTPTKQRSRRFFNLYRVCFVLVAIFVVRCFCCHFIFTNVNYHRFTDSGLFPLIKALFYPEHP